MSYAFEPPLGTAFALYKLITALQFIPHVVVVSLNSGTVVKGVVAAMAETTSDCVAKSINTTKFFILLGGKKPVASVF